MNVINYLYHLSGLNTIIAKIMYFIEIGLNWCLRRLTKNKLDPQQIRTKALEMLDEWEIQMYATNKHLYKIPAIRRTEQLEFFIKQLENN